MWTGGAQRVYSEFSVLFQTRKKMRRMRVEMWTSVQDALSAISSHQHFSACGQLVPREYDYFPSENILLVHMGRMCSTGFGVGFRGGRRQKVGLTEIYFFAGWSSQ